MAMKSLCGINGIADHFVRDFQMQRGFVWTEGTKRDLKNPAIGGCVDLTYDSFNLTNFLLSWFKFGSCSDFLTFSTPDGITAR